jgi:hypothetical protein
MSARSNPKNWPLCRRRKGRIRPLGLTRGSDPKWNDSVHGDEMHTLSDVDTETAMQVDGISQAVSRLQMAAETSQVPRVVAFGRRKGGQGLLRKMRARSVSDGTDVL